MDDATKKSLQACDALQEYEQYLQNASQSSNKFSSTLKSLGKSIGTELLNIGTGFAIGLAIDGVIKAIDEAIVTYDELQEKFQSSQSSYDSAKAEVESVTSELDQINVRISEINSQPLTLSSQAELDNLISQRTELENILKVKESIATATQNQLALDALNASNAETSALTALSADKSDFTKSLLKINDWFLGDNEVATVLRAFNPILNSAADKYTSFTDAQIAQVDIDKIKELQEEQQKLYDWFDSDIAKEGMKTNSGGFQSKTKELEDTTSAITELQTELAEKQSLISQQIAAMSDESGVPLKGYEDRVNELKNILNQIEHFDTSGMTDIEKTFNAIDEYFGQSKTSDLKSYFQDLANAGQLTKDSFKDLGISASLIGVDHLSDVVDYFNDMATAASEASDEANKLDTSISGIEAAFESENAGDNYVKLNDYIKQAKELYDQGLVGTDEFKTVAEALSYGIDSTAESFIDNYNRIKNYFVEDDDGNLTANGINQFLTDLSNKGQELANNNPAKDYANSWAVWDDEAQKWTIDIDNTAEAAKELGVSVEVFEALLGRIKDYDNLGDFDFHSAIDDLNTVTNSLSGLEEIYDNMDSGAEKDALGKRIEQWKSRLDGWENDLSTLDSDVVLNIKLQYDLESLKAEINSVREDIEAGDNSIENYATLITQNQKYINTAEEGIGFNVEGVEIPVEYTAREGTIEALKDQLKYATSDEKIEIQAEIDNLQTLQMEFLDAFSEVHPEINAESSMDEVQSALNDFINSEQGHELLINMAIDDQDAKERVAEILDMNAEDIVVDVEANDNATPVLTQLNDEEVKSKIVEFNAKDDATGILQLWNDSEANPKFTSLSAWDKASYVIGLWNSLTPEQKEAYLNGEITVVDNATGEIQIVDNALNSLPLSPTASIYAHDYTSSAVSSALSSLNSVDGKTVHTYIFTHKLGDSDLTGTAHASGTVGLYPIPKLSCRALALGTLQDDSWLNPNWRTKKSEIALTGEEGQELVVTRANRWFTVGDHGAEFAHIPKGSIVFNKRQTEQLLSKGKINSRGTAMIGGTAYAGGASGSFNFSGGLATSQSYKYDSSANYSQSYSDVQSATQEVADSVQEAADASDEFKENLDLIEIKLDRIQRIISNLDLQASSAYRNWDDRNKNLSSQLSEITNEISLQQRAYDRYIQEANNVGLDASWQEKIKNGEMNIETITDEDLKNKIDDYQSWYEKALDCRDAIYELQETESELYEQRFQNLVDHYDAIINQIEHVRTTIENNISQTEDSGYLVSTKYYSELIQNENKTLSQLASKRNELINSLNDAVSSGKIDEYSEAWYSMKEEINDVSEAIQDSQSSLIEFNNAIRDLKWDIFDTLQERISGITDESDFLIELLESQKMFDDKGKITEYGKSTMGLHGVNYNTFMSLADEYKKEMDSIDSQLQNDPYNQTLIDRRKELLELQQESILAAEDEKQAIKDLVEDGIKEELDSLQDLIDKYGDMLDSQKDMYDYQKEIAEKQKEIAELEKQLAAYQGDDSEEGFYNRQDITNQLEEARLDLEETQYERSIADQKKMLDELYTDYETVLNMRLDNIDMLIMDVIGNINTEAVLIKDTIVSEADSVGYTLSNSMSTIWNTANSTLTDGNNKIVNVLTTYGDKFTSSNTLVQQAINDLKNLMQQAIDDANKKAQENISYIESTQTSTPTPAPSTSNNTQQTTSSGGGGDGVPNIGDYVTFVSGSYYYSSDGMTPTGNQLLGQGVYITLINNASWATKPYHIARDQAGNQPLGWVSLDQLSGYSTGLKRSKSDHIAWIDENNKPETIIKPDGSHLSLITKDSSVLNNRAHENLWSLANNPVQFFNSISNLSSSIPQINSNQNVQEIENNVTITIPIEKVNDYNDFISQMQKDKTASQLIQSIVLGDLAGNGKLNKFNIKI